MPVERDCSLPVERFDVVPHGPIKYMSLRPLRVARTVDTHTMSGLKQLASQRSWFPVPVEGWNPELIRWILLDGNRYAVTAGLLFLTFISFLVVGSIWTFEMHQLLTETAAVQSILAALMSGIILLVSIVVSINSIILSHDITAISTQEDRIEGTIEFRREVGRIAEADETPTDPSSFLLVMTGAIHERADALQDADGDVDEEFANDIRKCVESISETATDLEDSLHRVYGGEFRSLWLGLGTDYGPMMNRMRDFASTYKEELSEREEKQFNDLIHLFELFATGKQYFKTLYYNNEIPDLSRTLLVASLPAIIITAWAILAIDANIFPDFWILGLPPLLTFVGFIFTIALSPFIILTAYMLRVATVTRRTAAMGPFALRS